MRKLLIVSAALVLVGAACQQAANNDATDAPVLQEGEQAPRFTLKSPDAEVSLNDYRGEKPVLLYFSMGPG